MGGAGGSAGSVGTGGAAGGAGGTPADASRDASGGAGGINIVQTSPTETSTEDVPTLTLAEAPAAGNAIIVGVTCHSTFNIDCVISPSGVSDNQGNRYARIVQGEAILSSQQGARGYIFIAENISAPNGEVVISVDPDGTSTLQAVSWGAVEVSGLAAAPSLYTSGSSLVSGNGATATTATTDLATTQANELAVGVASGRSDDTNMLITTWTQHHVHQNAASGIPGYSMVTRLLTSTGTVSHTWTHDPPTCGVTGIIATFRGATPN